MSHALSKTIWKFTILSHVKIKYHEKWYLTSSVPLVGILRNLELDSFAVMHAGNYNLTAIINNVAIHNATNM